MTSTPQRSIPVTRADVVGHYCRHFQAMGAPAEKLLELSGIPPELIAVPNALVPLRNAFHFAELACDALQTEHLGLHVGLASSLEDLGIYGRSLLKSRTVGGYLQKGINHFNTLNSGGRLWVSLHGEDLRLNFASQDIQGLGAYQDHLFTLVITVNTLRKAAGLDWCPSEVGLAYKSVEPFPRVDTFGDARILGGFDYSYITFPRELLKAQFSKSATDSTSGTMEEPGAPLPTDLIDLILAQVDALSAEDRDLHIGTIAESLSMSRRSLQRAIEREGLNYRQVLAQHRMDKAAQWLIGPEKSITEIAVDLGYTDISNFARAFRRHTGVSPRAFREGATHH